MASRRKPATTPEARENQMVSLAVELAEEQLRSGTASAMVITHFLKLGSSREKLEQQRLKHENELTQVKIEAVGAQQRQEELFKDALKAMRSYKGETSVDDDED